MGCNYSTNVDRTDLSGFRNVSPMISTDEKQTKGSNVTSPTKPNYEDSFVCSRETRQRLPSLYFDDTTQNLQSCDTKSVKRSESCKSDTSILDGCEEFAAEITSSVEVTVTIAPIETLNEMNRTNKECAFENNATERSLLFQKLFKLADFNLDEVLTLSELVEALASTGQLWNFLRSEDAVNHFDLNDDGKIDSQEFARGMTNWQNSNSIIITDAIDELKKAIGIMEERLHEMDLIDRVVTANEEAELLAPEKDTPEEKSNCETTIPADKPTEKVQEKTQKKQRRKPKGKGKGGNKRRAKQTQKANGKC